MNSFSLHSSSSSDDAAVSGTNSSSIPLARASRPGVTPSMEGASPLAPPAERRRRAEEGWRRYTEIQRAVAPTVGCLGGRYVLLPHIVFFLERSDCTQKITYTE